MVGILRYVTEWVDRWRTGGEESAEGDAERQVESFDYAPEEIESRSDILTKLGITPATFVRRLLEQEGGRIYQRDFHKYVNFSASTISRLLRDLEDEEKIVRIHVGQRKLIVLPEEAPLPMQEPAGDDL